MHTLTDIRAQFLDYFKQHDHGVLASSSLVPQNDPTLMFANAGMNQFKNIFTGVEKAPAVPRAATSQKCVRAGGKHNDLDNVGYTARHHTFFEMLGNFSFGDYFKEGAIELAWNLITKEWGIDKNRLCVTVYHTDDDAFHLWKKIAGLPEDKIIRIATNDNFWAMGDTGPCGPCSEIFYDHGAHIAGGPPGSADQDGDRFVEIWNLVFMQYEQRDANTRVALPKPSIDTGMGLERVAAVLQGVHDNYDVDLFKTIIAASQHESRNTNPESRNSHRVIADHLRACGFLIADGVLPSNEGRGYVLRRIMRRAMRHAHILGCRDPLMHRLVPTLVQLMGSAYPELARAQAIITETLKLEEERFKQTLERGLKLLEEERANVRGGKFSGEAAFKLYDTYGFPLDLTQDILRADNIAVDIAAFDVAMNEQKTRARAAHKGSGDSTTSALWFDLRERVGATEFLGYSHDSAQAVITAIIQDGKEVQNVNAGESAIILTNQTPFYGESGGQVGDSGTLHSDSASALISDCKKPLPDLHAHEVTLQHGTLNVGDTVTLSIHVENRARIRANHSATHLLHAALRKHLGDHVTQKGSLVAADGLRFDISHPKAISTEELAAIETEVNDVIWRNSDISTKLMTPQDAVAAGAMALFGEKYGDEVRVLAMGDGYSVELCGGTHAARTGDIGLIKITSESSVAAGIRRIEALTQAGALAYLSAQDDAVKALAGALKTKPEDVSAKISSLMDEKKKLEKELAEAKKKLALSGGGGGSAEPTIETIGATQFVHRSFDGVDAKALRDIAQSYQQKYPEAVVAVASNTEGKASIIVAVGKSAFTNIKADAPTLVRAAAAAVGGQGGGGKPDFAQAGGPDGDKLDAALNAVKQVLAA